MTTPTNNAKELLSRHESGNWLICSSPVSCQIKKTKIVNKKQKKNVQYVIFLLSMVHQEVF